MPVPRLVRTGSGLSSASGPRLLYVPVLENRPARPYVAMTSRVTSEAELRRAADQGFPRLYGWLRQRAIVPAGPPLIRFRAFDPVGKPARIDVGVPIADAIDGGDGIEVAILPAGEWLTFLHRGPYTHASEPHPAAAHATVRAWAAEHDLRLAKEDSAGDEPALSGCVEQYPHRPGRGARLCTLGDRGRLPRRSPREMTAVHGETYAVRLVR
jgi:effector-binding domain-containing protein